METWTAIYAAILGILQGTTEFLPVSSSGHLIVFSWWMEGQPLPITLNIALHLGTLSAVLFYFWKDWYRLGTLTLRRVTGGPASFESDILLPALLVGSIPAGIIGILWQDQIEAIFHNPLSVTIPLAVVGFLLWWVDKKAPSTMDIRGLTVGRGFLVGLAQALALIPGVSRSGITILGSRLLGIERQDAARFSFLLGTPAMAGAALLNHEELLASIGDPIFYLGFLVSMVVGVITIGLLLRFLRRFGFGAFAFYRLALALVIFTVAI